MQGVVPIDSPAANYALHLSNPMQTHAQVISMMNQLAADNSVDLTTYCNNVLTPQTCQYKSIHEPDFDVYRIPARGQESIVLARRDTTGHITALRSSRPLDYMLAVLPHLRERLVQAQEDGMRFEIVTEGPPGSCDRDNKIIAINDAIAMRGVDSPQKKAVLQAMLLSHELSHYENGNPIFKNSDEYVLAREADEGLAMLKQLQLIHENPQYAQLFRDVVMNALAGGEYLLSVHHKYEQDKQKISAHSPEERALLEADLENSAARTLGNFSGNQMYDHDRGITRRERWRIEFMYEP